ncbi:hypothetical protein DXG03_000293 [Asterophora parasitica]|uniref:Uncharacterized protein n=1 Tax=Asterophora parasitica TaxID=117018 RepID=A0A9P7KGS2_9AGAR|nr:hypothetical protein DXG03_000293 [Asterophora parasitica]
MIATGMEAILIKVAGWGSKLPVRTEVESVIHSDSGFATVAFLRIKSAVLEVKDSQETLELEVPSVLENDFISIRDAVASAQEGSTQFTDTTKPTQANQLSSRVATSRKLDSWISVSNIERSLDSPLADLSIEEEVTECFNILEGQSVYTRDETILVDHPPARLKEYGLDVSNCVNINIFISSIDLFVRINAVYSTFFGSSPPARACVAVDLPHPLRVRLDVIAFAESRPSDRQALHVQSLSYWAPANIGPYSQAITAGERIFISGQIGLIPSQLALPYPRSLPSETALASQHISRITDVLRRDSGLGWPGNSQLELYWFANTQDLLHVKRVVSPDSIPTLYLSVKALPKDALIEKQVLLHTGRCAIVDEDVEDGFVMESREPIFEQSERS